MKLDDYAIQQLAPYMTGHTDHGANFKEGNLSVFLINMVIFEMYMPTGFHQLRKDKTQQKKHTLKTD